MQVANTQFDRTKIYKVFISYCWTSAEHENWVYDLAEKLLHSGIDVKLDKWDLKQGQDKYAFMESMVNDEEINKVLVICDKGYKEKADKREGGVGTETQIITAELYSKVEETKFIPIIAECGERFDSYMPTFIKTRIGIDLSNDDTYEDEFEKLIRAITERPKHRKPKLGNLPSYLFEDEISTFKTKNIVATFKNNIFKNPKQAQSIVNDFMQDFMAIFSSFVISRDEYTEPYDEVIYNKIHDMKNLRDDYISLLEEWLKNDEIFDIDKIIKLFEDMYAYTEFKGEGSFYRTQMDHFKFFIWELFLYTVAILLGRECYAYVNILLNTKYFLNLRFHGEHQCDFLEFRFANVQSLEDRNRRLNMNLLSYTADLLCKRAVINGQNYVQRLTEVDLLLYYYSIITNKSYCWFPATYIYAEAPSGGELKINILKRLISKRHFEKVKALFNVDTPKELIDLFNTFNNEKYANIGYDRAFDSVPVLSYHILPDSIATSI